MALGKSCVQNYYVQIFKFINLFHNWNIYLHRKFILRYPPPFLQYSLKIQWLIQKKFSFLNVIAHSNDIGSYFDKWNCKYEVNMFGKMWLTTNIMNIEILYIF